MKGISTSSKVCPILSAMYSSSLNVYHTISHVRITMPQHELSYSPNKFAIRDPCGGNWGEWGQKDGKIENNVKNSDIFKCIFRPSLVQI